MYVYNQKIKDRAEKEKIKKNGADMNLKIKML